MNLPKMLLVISAVQLFSVSNAKAEDCYSGYRSGSAEQNACRARNEDRAKQELRYKEDQDARKAVDDNQKLRAEMDSFYANEKREKALELQKKQQDSKWLEEYSRNQKKEQDDKKSNEQKQIEVLGDAVAFTELASKAYINHSSVLEKAGKCKESRATLEKGLKNENRRARGLVNLLQAVIAERCDKDKKLALTYYFRSADSGSLTGKVALDNFLHKQ